MRLSSRLLPLFAALSLFVLAIDARADDAADARAFIESAAAAVRADASAAAQPGDQQKRFAIVLERDFDVASIGRFVLGRYWASASEPVRQDFVAAFRKFLAKSYAERFFVYAGRPMSVTSARAGGDGIAIVRTDVQEASNRTVGVDWHVARLDGGWRIVDVVVEGVSMGQTQRDDFGAYLNNNKGDVAKLSALLNDRSK